MFFSFLGDVALNCKPLERRSHLLLYIGAFFFMIAHIIYASAYYSIIEHFNKSFFNPGMYIACVIMQLLKWRLWWPCNKMELFDHIKWTKRSKMLYNTCAKSLQLCPTLCSLIDCSPLGFSVHRILQARVLEQVSRFLQEIILTWGWNPHLFWCLHWQAGSLLLVLPWKPHVIHIESFNCKRQTHHFISNNM